MSQGLDGLLKRPSACATIASLHPMPLLALHVCELDRSHCTCLAAESSPVQAALLAMEVCVWGLSALQNTTAALDLFEQVITPHLAREDAIQPVQPDTPKMLPSVHVMWGFLVTALQVLSCCSLPPLVVSMHGRHRPVSDQRWQLSIRWGQETPGKLSCSDKCGSFAGKLRSSRAWPSPGKLLRCCGLCKLANGSCPCRKCISGLMPACIHL